jgi:hypothetical protein
MLVDSSVWIAYLRGGDLVCRRRAKTEARRREAKITLKGHPWRSYEPDSGIFRVF